jgi:hypothetical protein
MAHVDNPRKQFQFNIIVPGLNPFLAQEVKTPDAEFDEVEHGDAGFVVKTAGLKKISTLTVSKICSAVFVDNFFKAWQKRILSTDFGGGQLPSQYKCSIMVEEYSSDGITVINREVYRGCWPKKLNGKDFNRKGSENTIESIEFSVDQDD